MKKALISPNESPIQYVSGWGDAPPYKAIYSNYPDSCRVAEVCDAEFEVAQPLFWVDCADDVLADQFYYDTVTQVINPIVDVPSPATSGLQTV